MRMHCRLNLDVCVCKCIFFKNNYLMIAEDADRPVRSDLAMA